MEASCRFMHPWPRYSFEQQSASARCENQTFSYITPQFPAQMTNQRGDADAISASLRRVSQRADSRLVRQTEGTVLEWDIVLTWILIYLFEDSLQLPRHVFFYFCEAILCERLLVGQEIILLQAVFQAIIYIMTIPLLILTTKEIFIQIFVCSGADFHQIFGYDLK